jgi:hypothetical protein
VALPLRPATRFETALVLQSNKFTLMDFSKLAYHDASGDLGAMVLVQQTMLDKFRTWCQQVNVAHIFIFAQFSRPRVCSIFTTHQSADPKRPFPLLWFSSIRPTSMSGAVTLMLTVAIGPYRSSSSP